MCYLYLYIAVFWFHSVCEILQFCMYIIFKNTGYLISSVLLLAFSFRYCLPRKARSTICWPQQMCVSKCLQSQNTQISAFSNLYFSQNETRRSFARKWKYDELLKQYLTTTIGGFNCVICLWNNSISVKFPLSAINTYSAFINWW